MRQISPFKSSASTGTGNAPASLSSSAVSDRQINDYSGILVLFTGGSNLAENIYQEVLRKSYGEAIELAKKAEKGDLQFEQVSHLATPSYGNRLKLFYFFYDRTATLR